MAHSRLLSKLRNGPTGVEYERGKLFLELARDHGLITVHDALAATSLSASSTKIVGASLSNLVNEGLLEVLKIGGRNYYRLPDESP